MSQTGNRPPHVLVLSFMGPETEAQYEEKIGSRFVSARLIAEKVRVEARKIFTEMITRIASSPCISGKTLREHLKGRDGISRWWYHRLSDKDSVGIHSDYTTIIRLYCIKFVAKEHGISVIRVYGSKRNFVRSLKNTFQVVLHKPVYSGFPFRPIFVFLRALAGRVYFVAYYLYLLTIFRKLSLQEKKDFDVLLQGYWDWSVTPQPVGGLKDRYFTNLPGMLRDMGYRVGWLARFSPQHEVWQRKRPLKDVAHGLQQYTDVILIEYFVRVSDIFRIAMNMRYILVWLTFSCSGKFRSLFMKDGLNFYPVFKDSLSSPFFSTGILHSELMSLGVERVCSSLCPKMILTFLELFIESRPIYAGAKRADPHVKIYTAQHAAYCSDKAFGTIDRDVELKGLPDGCPMPAPDGIFAMGELSSRMWLKNGYLKDKVLLTGGLRYRHLKIANARNAGKKSGNITILLIAGMNEYLDFDMCEAICRATEGETSVLLRIRNHPSYWITDMDGFRRFRSRIEVSTVKDAYEDLSNADLVMFTHSSLSEEALLMGIPVWQWLWAGFNTSVFVDMPGAIPCFTSVLKLKAALKEIIADESRFRPTDEVKLMVLENCFGQDPGGATAAIAEEIKRQLNQSVRKIYD